MAVLVDAISIVTSVVSLYSWVVSSRRKHELERRFHRLDSGLYVLDRHIQTADTVHTELVSDVRTLRQDIQKLEDTFQSYFGLLVPSAGGMIPAGQHELVAEIVEKYIGEDVASLDAISDRGVYTMEDGKIPMIWTPSSGNPLIASVPDKLLTEWYGIKISRDASTVDIALPPGSLGVCPSTKELLRVA